MARVMVVDDEPEVRELLTSMLTRAGHQVVSAPDAATAYHLLNEPPQAIFVDIDMPGETGVEFVLKLREHEACAKVPVAFVTAFRERARPLLSTGAAGVVGVVDKPFRLETITATLEKMLGVAVASTA